MSIRQIKQKTDIHTIDQDIKSTGIKINTINRQVFDEGMSDAEIEMLLLSNLNSRERMWWNRLTRNKKKKYINQARNEIKAYHLKNPLAANPVSAAAKSVKKDTGRMITSKRGKAVISGTIESAAKASTVNMAASKEKALDNELIKGNVDGRKRRSSGGSKGQKKEVSSARRKSAKAIRGTLAVIGGAKVINKLRMVRRTKSRLTSSVIKSAAKKTAHKEKIVTAKGLGASAAAASAGGLEDGAGGAAKEGAAAVIGMVFSKIPLPIKLIIIGIIIILAVLLFIIPVLFGGAFSVDEEEENRRTALIPIEINGTYDGANGTLEISGTTISIPDIPISGDRGSFSGFKEGSGTTHEIPDGLGRIHTYMGWQKITSPSSPQYAFKEATGMPFNEEGFGFVNGRYVVACTTTFGNIGDEITVYKDDGTVIPCVIGDIKNQDDPGCNMYGHLSGACIIEFVVDQATWYHPFHANPGTASCHPEWNGTIVRIDSGAQDVSLSGTINEDGTVTISGTLGGVELYTTGTLSGNSVSTTGYYGNGASAIGNGGVEGMVQFAIGLAEDDNLWYSQDCRECYLCYHGGGYGYGGGTHDYYDCSSLVTASLAHGMGNPDALYECSHGAPTTESITDLIEKCGFVNMGPPSQCEPQRGDILWYRSGGHGHVAICTGEGEEVAAHGSRGRWTNNTAGQISVINTNFASRSYTRVYRFAGE